MWWRFAGETKKRAEIPLERTNKREGEASKEEKEEQVQTATFVLKQIYHSPVWRVELVVTVIKGEFL